MSARAARLRTPVLAALLTAAAAVALAGGVSLGAAGCRKRAEERAPALPPPVGETEIERGRAACQDYIDAVCACAEARPEDAEVRGLCDMSGAKLRSLDMVAQVNRAPADAKERAATSATIRRIVRSCIEGMGDLATRGCPR